MAQPHYMTYNDFVSSTIFSTQSNLVQYCMQIAIIQNKQWCSKCNNNMYLMETSLDDYTDGFCLNCPTSPHHRVSIRRDSIIEGKKISLQQFLRILWHNCNTLSVSQAAKEEAMCPKTVRNIYESIRRCMVEDLLMTPVMIGGPGKIVEIDESLFGRRKYNRGKRVKGKWILGGTERGSKECFLVECTVVHTTIEIIILWYL